MLILVLIKSFFYLNQYLRAVSLKSEYMSFVMFLSQYEGHILINAYLRYISIYYNEC